MLAGSPNGCPAERRRRKRRPSPAGWLGGWAREAFILAHSQGAEAQPQAYHGPQAT